MVRIPLANGGTALVDDEDLERVQWFAWRRDQKGYVIAYMGHRYVFLHRHLLDAPTGVEVDHKDGDPLNNTRENIRLATRSQNEANKASGRGKSRFKGVSLRDRGRRRWVAYIHLDRRWRGLGSYFTEEEAARAYDAAARETFGEFARLNFPGSEAA
jgi:hypothetical protein